MRVARAPGRPAAVADSTSPALSVQTSGRNRPVASANPATAPEQPAAGISLTAKTVPDVSILGAAQHDLRGLRRRTYAGDQHRAPSMIRVIS